jgi:glycosyltransferase involved in cell wall biosynthesis
VRSLRLERRRSGSCSRDPCSGQEGYFASEIEPHVDGEEVVFVGEIGGARRKELFAHAKAFVMPIRWAEPFGMVMVEALACGTPVIAFPEGAASEIVIDGENGFYVADEREMGGAVGWLDAIDPVRCRESVASRYDVSIVADGYEAVYDRAVGAATSRNPRFARRGQSLAHANDRADRVVRGASRGSTLRLPAERS